MLNKTAYYRDPMLLQGHIGKSKKFAQKSLVYTYSQLMRERISQDLFFAIKIFIELTRDPLSFVNYVNYVMDTYVGLYMLLIINLTINLNIQLSNSHIERENQVN